MKKRVLWFIVLVLAASFVTGCTEVYSSASKSPEARSLHILVSEDMQAFEGIIDEYFSEKAAEVQYRITYEGIGDVQKALESADCPYDAVWISNSIPLQMLSGGQRITNSKFTGVSPVVFAMKGSLVEQLGFEHDVLMEDIVAAVQAGRFQLRMPSITQSSSGRSAYIAIISALLGSPNVLTAEHLTDPSLQENLRNFFANVERAAGSEDFLTSNVLAYGGECIVASEATIIRLNRALEERKEEPLQLLYPLNGVTIGDMPLAYINKDVPQKLEDFLGLQQFILSPDGQSSLAQLGVRTDLGGLIAPKHSAVFKEDWGIRNHEYIMTMVYPAGDVITKALTLYQEALKKPSRLVFCLDYSGSMGGRGEESLEKAMEYILNPEKAGKDFIQLTEKDEITLVLFGSSVKAPITGTGDNGVELYRTLEVHSPGGGTQMHAAVQKALELVKDTDADLYSVAIVNMTDGAPDNDTKDRRAQTRINEMYQSGTIQNIPIYSIMFGNASDGYLIPLAEISGGKVFDGSDDLGKTFREVMGYQ